MKRPRSELLGLAAAVLLAGGCAHGGQVTQDEEYPSEAKTVVQVANFNWSDMNVYVVRGSVRHRLGTVTSMSKRTFPFPSHLLYGGESPQLLADPIGSSRTYLSPPLNFAPGQTLEWRLENNLNLSSALIR